MNYMRVYSALLCALFLSVPQISMGFAALTDEIRGVSAIKREIGDMSEDEIVELGSNKMDALAENMAKLSKGDDAVFQDLLKKDSVLAKNPYFARFQQKFEDESAVVKEAAAREEDINQIFKDSGGDNIASADDKHAAGLNTLRTTEQTRDMMSSIKKDFEEKCDAESKRVMRRFVEDLKYLKLSNQDFANVYLGKLDKGIIGLDPAEASTLQNDINQAVKAANKEALVRACSKVAKAEALSAVGDIKTMIKHFEGAGAIANRGTNFLQGSTAKLDKAWEDFSDKAASGEDLDKIVAPGKSVAGTNLAKGLHGAPEETQPITALDQFIDDNFGKLNDSVNAEYSDIMGRLDAANARIAGESGIELDSYITKFRTKTFFSGRGVLSESWEEFKTSLKTTNIRDLAANAIEKIKGGGRWLKTKFGLITDTLESALLFQIPTIFQSAYLAQQEKAAQLASWARPIEYGGKVWQVPDWCINLENPTASIPLYVQIPVNSVSEPINATLARMFANTISQGAPTSNNGISGAIHNVSSDIWSFGSALETKILRYQFTDEFLKYTDIAVMYGSPTSMAPTASANIGSSEFTGYLVSLKTGQVIDGSGETFDASGIPQAQGVPLIPGDTSFNIWGTLQVAQTAPASQGSNSFKPLVDIYAKLIDKMETLGIKVTYTQYVDIGSGSSGPTVGKANSDYFNPDCINEETGALKNSNCPCLLVQGLTDIQNGIELGPDGQARYVAYSPSQASDQTAGDVVAAESKSLTVEKNSQSQSVDVNKLTPSSTSKEAKVSKTSKSQPSTALKTTESADSNAPAATGWKGLGAIMPIFGWGKDKYPSIIGTTQPDPLTGKNLVASGVFKGFDPSSVSFGGVSEVIENAQEGTTTQREYADSDILWALQGCWIYLCTNTPFIQEIIANDPSLIASILGSLVDYIVFMDEDFNIVPLMVPDTVTINYSDGGTDYSYKKSVLTVNPLIKYWTSLIFYNQQNFLYEGTPIMYDLQGNKLKSANLGTIAGAKKPSGFIPTYLNNAQGTSIATTYPNIYDQFQMHKSALVYKLQELDMTFGKVLFQNSNYQLNVQGQKIPTYTPAKNWNLFGTAATSDLLVALDGNFNPLELPNTNLVYMQSLITDITYKLDTKTNSWSVAKSLPSSAGAKATGFSSSPLKLNPTTNMAVQKSDGSYEIAQGTDSYLQNLGTWLGIQNPTLDGTLAEPLQSGYLTVNTTVKNDVVDARIITANQSIITDAQKGRVQWLAALDGVARIGSGANARLANLANTLTTGYAASNNCYVYQINPILSDVSSDYFVVVNTQNPTIDSLKKLVNLKKLPKGSKATIISVSTGAEYDMNGNPILNKNGYPKTLPIPDRLYRSGKVTAQIIHDVIVAQFTNLPTAFAQSYKSMVDTYAQGELVPKGPYSFGSYKVAIRAADKDSYSFVYFDAASMTKSEPVPADMYIIVDANTMTPDSYNPAKKQLLISLITGIVVNQSGTVMNKLLPDNLETIIAAVQGGWSPWITGNVARLKALSRTQQENMQEDEEKLESKISKFSEKYDAAMNKDQDEIAQIINRLEPSGSGLATPYAGLERDKTSGNYVHPSPLQQDELLYLFMGTGKIYREDGSYVSSYLPAHIQAVRDEYGVVVDSKTKKQKLAVPMMQPSIIMDPDDVDIKIGQSGKSLLAAGTSEFPGGQAGTLKKGYGLYFSKIMGTYYVLDSKRDRWMSVDGGHLYQKNGQPIIEHNQVAMSKTHGPLLVYKNKNGFMQAYMNDASDYANISESNEMMQWYGLSEPFHIYNVSTNAKSAEAIPTSYTVEDSKKAKVTLLLKSLHCLLLVFVKYGILFYF